MKKEKYKVSIKGDILNLLRKVSLTKEYYYDSVLDETVITTEEVPRGNILKMYNHYFRLHGDLKNKKFPQIQIEVCK